MSQTIRTYWCHFKILNDDETNVIFVQSISCACVLSTDFFKKTERVGNILYLCTKVELIRFSCILLFAFFLSKCRYENKLHLEADILTQVSNAKKYIFSLSFLPLNCSFNTRFFQFLAASLPFTAAFLYTTLHKSYSESPLCFTSAL